MTQRTYIQLIDDIDGSEGEATHTFTVNGTTYEIDLSMQNGKRFNEALLPFVEKGRRIRGAGPAPTRRTQTPHGPDVDPRVVRAWAVENGYEISLRGRVSREIVAAWREATS